MRKKIRVAGVDEAGRGPLAGPVVAAAVILDAKYVIKDLADSKTLSEKKREILYDEIMQHALAVSHACIEVEEIDRINIFQASMLAMQRAVIGLDPKAEEVWIDGTHSPSLDVPAFTLIKGDQLHSSISAASIIAKVTRDRIMRKYALQYPGYGFEQHKGYGTRLHMQALQQMGPCSIHRRSYGPVKALLV